MIPTYAVVPSDGRDCLYACLSSLVLQVDRVILVANGDAWADPRDLRENMHMVADTGADRNISRWWNLGLAEAERIAALGGHDQWNTLVVNDDIVAPVNLVSELSAAMRRTTAVLAYPNQHDDADAVWRKAGPINLFHRITGYAWMLRGETGLRLDESLVWWYGDDDLDWRCREAGGAVLVSGCAVEHKSPNGYMNKIPELHAQAGRDRETFRAKWGITPW